MREAFSSNESGLRVGQRVRILHKMDKKVTEGLIESISSPELLWIKVNKRDALTGKETFSTQLVARGSLQKGE